MLCQQKAKILNPQLKIKLPTKYKNNYLQNTRIRQKYPPQNIKKSLPVKYQQIVGHYPLVW